MSLALAALLLFPLARAAEPAPAPVEAAAAAEPAAPAAVEAAAPAPGGAAVDPAAPAEADPPPVEVTVTSVTTLDRVASDGLRLATCAVPHGDPARGAPAGALVFEIRVRRGKVALATLASADPHVAAFGPCFERELVAWSWPVRRDDLRVTVRIGDAAP